MLALEFRHHDSRVCKITLLALQYFTIFPPFPLAPDPLRLFLLFLQFLRLLLLFYTFSQQQREEREKKKKKNRRNSCVLLLVSSCSPVESNSNTPYHPYPAVCVYSGLYSFCFLCVYCILHRYKRYIFLTSHFCTQCFPFTFSLLFGLGFTFLLLDIGSRRQLTINTFSTARAIADDQDESNKTGSSPERLYSLACSRWPPQGNTHG